MPNDDLKNLPPEERLKKLKELEKQKKKEIEDAQKLIKDSEVEITERHKFKEKVPIGAVAADDLEILSDAEKEIVAAHRGIKKKAKAEEDVSKKRILASVEEEEEVAEKRSRKEAQQKEESLEAMARGAPELPEALRNSEYAAHLSQKPMQNLYQEITKINREVEDKGYINREEERRVQYLASAVERKLEDVQAGRYSFTEDVGRAASLTQQIGDKLRGMYHSEQKDGKNELYKY